MKRPEPDSPAAKRRSQAAADWLARRDRGLTAAEQDEFLDWLAVDARHGEWLALHRRTVGDYGALAHWRPEHSAEPNPDLLAPSRPRIHWLAHTLIATAAALAVALVWWRGAPAGSPPTPSAFTEHQRRFLADGSTVELNQGTEVTTDFSPTERRAILVRGEALFTVARDASRPFLVRAGGVDVRAVGTAFAVRLELSAVEVLVTEGRVVLARIAAADAPTRDENPASRPSAQSAEVSAGQRALVALTTAEPPQITPASPQLIAGQLYRQPQWLDFASAPLGAAVAEFNRRNRVQFVLADAELAALPIIASIRSDNVDGFARFLAAAPGVELEHRDTEILVRRRR
jgi:transmembrane sensor